MAKWSYDFTRAIETQSASEQQKLYIILSKKTIANVQKWLLQRLHGKVVKDLNPGINHRIAPEWEKPVTGDTVRPCFSEGTANTKKQKAN